MLLGGDGLENPCVGRCRSGGSRRAGGRGRGRRRLGDGCVCSGGPEPEKGHGEGGDGGECAQPAHDHGQSMMAPPRRPRRRRDPRGGRRFVHETGRVGRTGDSLDSSTPREPPGVANMASGTDASADVVDSVSLSLASTAVSRAGLGGSVCPRQRSTEHDPLLCRMSAHFGIAATLTVQRQSELISRANVPVSW